MPVIKFSSISFNFRLVSPNILNLSDQMKFLPINNTSCRNFSPLNAINTPKTPNISPIIKPKTPKSESAFLKRRSLK